MKDNILFIPNANPTYAGIDTKDRMKKVNSNSWQNTQLSKQTEIYEINVPIRE